MVNVIGLGYIGLPTALMLAAHGVEVVGTDYNKDLVAKTLLSRCEGQFKRNGLIVNGIRYRNYDYKDEYLENFRNITYK